MTGNFSYATSFPQPILMGAAFDDPLIQAVAGVVSTEGRAFNNAGRGGLNYWTPTINRKHLVYATLSRLFWGRVTFSLRTAFKDPRWGRGQESPGEDPLHLQNYVYNLVIGLQGGVDPKPHFKVAANCKHYAAYDLEHWEGVDRQSFNAVVTQQDLSEYYLPPFQTCVRDAKVASVLCSYNAVNGIPSCANKFILHDILRDHWAFADDRWVVADCDAILNIYTQQNYTTDPVQAAADALLAGTDIDCRIYWTIFLPDALARGLVNTADLKHAVTHQYASLVRYARPFLFPNQALLNVSIIGSVTLTHPSHSHIASLDGPTSTPRKPNSSPSRPR